MTHNATTQAKESPVSQTSRLLNVAKSELEKIASDVAKDPTYFGRPSIELVVQNGAIAAVTVNAQRSLK